MQRIGILGGTFDPPHVGHLILAQYTMEALLLDQVLFVPAGDHPFKGDKIRASVAHRTAMVELAVSDNRSFSISDADLKRPGPHYSADTVQLIQSQYPQAQLFFVMGGDNLRALPSWTRARELYEFCRLAVMKRSDENITPEMHEAVLPGLKDRVDIVDAPLLGIWLSSTHLVDRLHSGKSIRYLVPDSVRDYIQQHGLYQRLS